MMIKVDWWLKLTDDKVLQTNYVTDRHIVKVISRVAFVTEN